jgi:hypothetical protein
MSVMTAKELWEHLERVYKSKPDEILMYTFWDSSDVEHLLPEDFKMTADEVWGEIVEEADYSLDEGVSLTNNVISGMVEELLEEEEEANV